MHKQYWNVLYCELEKKKKKGDYGDFCVEASYKTTMETHNIGKLVIIVGIDGAGKTTLLGKIERLMEESGKSSICLERKLFNEYTSEFSVSEYVKNYMRCLSGLLWGSQKQDPVTDLSDDVWLYMHAIWYDVFQKNILTPALRKYDYVIIDSWYYKIMARFLVNSNYQEKLFEQVFGKLYKGDIGIMLDADVELCVKRKRELSPGEVGRHHGELTETDPRKRFVKYQTKVREQLLKISNRNKWLICDVKSDWTDLENRELIQWLQKQ